MYGKDNLQDKNAKADVHFNTKTMFSSNYIHHIKKRWQAQLKYNELKEMFSWKCP